jgi:hypothetical protein
MSSTLSPAYQAILPARSSVTVKEYCVAARDCLMPAFCSRIELRFNPRMTDYVVSHDKWS